MVICRKDLLERTAIMIKIDSSSLQLHLTENDPIFNCVPKCRGFCSYEFETFPLRNKPLKFSRYLFLIPSGIKKQLASGLGTLIIHVSNVYYDVLILSEFVNSPTLVYKYSVEKGVYIFVGSRIRDVTKDLMA